MHQSSGCGIGCGQEGNIMVERYLDSIVSCRIRDQIPDYMFLRPKQAEAQTFSDFRRQLEQRAEQMQKSADSG